MTEIELDPDGVEAIMGVLAKSSLPGNRLNIRDRSEACARAYLAQALRRRDPFDAPVGVPALWKWKGYEVMIGTVEAPECKSERPHRVDVNDPSDGDWFIIDAEWWLPLPQPVESKV